MFDNVTRRGRRVVAAVALGAMILAFGAGTASADPIIDPTQTGSLTVHKFAEPDPALDPGAFPNDGSELDQPIPADPLPGAVFTIYPVTSIDLTTNAGWVDAANLQSTFDPATVSAGSTPAIPGQTLGAGVPGTTGADGIAAFPNLGVALYLVVETSTPTGFTPAASFLVSVPLTQTDAGGVQGWNYNVHVYPKNAPFEVTKTVEDVIDQDAAAVGDQVTYTITGDIPPVDPDAYRVVDALDPALTYTPNVTHTDVVVTVGGTVLTHGTDYTVTYTAGTNTVQVDLTAAGLAAAAAAEQADATAQVVVDLTVTVNAVGEISNIASVFPSQGAIDNDLPTVSTAAVTKWGSVSIDKSSSDAAITDLSGAVFEIYWTETATWDGDPASATRATVGAVDEWTTDAAGAVTAGPLRYSDFANGVALTAGEPGYRYYWLLETTALPGHELLAEPVGFVITDEDDATTVPTDVDVAVTNVPRNAGFQLPFTGGIGTIWFTIAGIGLLGGAILLLIRFRRSRA